MKKIIILVVISSFIIADTVNDRTMGRDTDPKRVSDLSKFKIFIYIDILGFFIYVKFFYIT